MEVSHPGYGRGSNPTHCVPPPNTRRRACGNEGCSAPRTRPMRPAQLLAQGTTAATRRPWRGVEAVLALRLQAKLLRRAQVSVRARVTTLLLRLISAPGTAATSTEHRVGFAPPTEEESKPPSLRGIKISSVEHQSATKHGSAYLAAPASSRRR